MYPVADLAGTKDLKDVIQAYENLRDTQAQAGHMLLEVIKLESKVAVGPLNLAAKAEAGEIRTKIEELSTIFSEIQEKQESKSADHIEASRRRIADTRRIIKQIGDVYTDLVSWLEAAEPLGKGLRSSKWAPTWALGVHET